MSNINVAERIARYSNIKRAKVSAISFASGGNIIATAHNRRVGGIPNKWTQHAEEVLIHKLNRIKAWNRFENITILVARVNTRGMVMAKPCRGCQKILNKYPVTVFYTNETGIVNKL